MPVALSLPSVIPKRSSEMICPCGGFVDVADLTSGRIRMACRACGRYEITEGKRLPDCKTDEAKQVEIEEMRVAPG